MGPLDGKVAFITGAARAQGRSHALRLAEEGADIVALDINGGVGTVPYPTSSAEELAETARLVEERGRRAVARYADVRDGAALDAAVSAALEELGHIDIVLANAGIMSSAPAWEMADDVWQDVIDINLTGAWRTVKATVPAMIAAGDGGAIVLTSSVVGLKGLPNVAAYASAKQGLAGLMRTLALELAPHNIRVNTVNPTFVETPMIAHDVMYRGLRPDLENPTHDDALPAFQSLNALPVPWIESADVTNAVAWLVSDEARYVTGVALPIDAGFLIK